MGARIAAGYLTRIEAALRQLPDFPYRGAPRDDYGPGIRVLGFERRVTIVYRVRSTDITVLRVLYAGREFDPSLEEPTD